MTCSLGSEAMFFQRIKTPGLAHNAYLLGDKEEAVLVDPRRDIEEYLTLARENDLIIKYVLETHRQEDFVIGSKEVAEKTGAKIVSLDHALFGHSDIRLADGETLTAGSLRFEALHTPGHTPESTSYAVWLADIPDRAWGVFTGDTLFIGETGRTDLTDPKKTREHAGLLYDAVHEKIAPLGDQTLLWPGHGSGSVCGGNIAERDESTLGLERACNPVFTKGRAAFVEAKLRERIPRPPYFPLMERLNLKGGIPVAKRPTEVKILGPKQFASESAQGIVLDARDPEAFAAGHVPRSYSVWQKGLSVFGGWLAGPSTPVFLVLSRMDDLESAVLSLSRIGIDGVGGVLGGGFDAWRDGGLEIARSGVVTPRELERRLGKMQVLDVREDSEFEEEGHIPHAAHMYIGYIEHHLRKLEPALDKSKPVAVTCSVGHRASVAASILRRLGFEQVENLLGGMTAWESLDLPREKGRDRSVTTPDIEGERQ